MGNRDALDGQIGAGSSLLKAVRENEGELPGVGRYLAVLDQANSQVMRARKERDNLLVSSREATFHLNKHLKAHRDAVSAIRHFIKSVLGAHSEKLIRYGMRPRPRRQGGVRAC